MSFLYNEVSGLKVAKNSLEIELAKVRGKLHALKNLKKNMANRDHQNRVGILGVAHASTRHPKLQPWLLLFLLQLHPPLRLILFL